MANCLKPQHRCSRSYLASLRSADPTGRFRGHDQSAANTRAQNEVYALLRNSFDWYRRESRRWGIALAARFILYLAAGAFAGFGLSAVVSVASRSVFVKSHLPVDFSLYVATFCILLFLYVPVRLSLAKKSISRTRQQEIDGDRLLLGRLDQILDCGTSLMSIAIMGQLFGLQTGLFFFSDHLALSPFESFRAVLDNLVQDTGTRIAPVVEHNLLSATVFWAFRTAETSLLGIAIFNFFWCRWRLLRIFEDYPIDQRQINAFCDWLKRICDNRQFGLRRFVAERTFLQTAHAFLRGNYTFEMSCVTPDIRRLFRKST